MVAVSATLVRAMWCTLELLVSVTIAIVQYHSLIHAASVVKEVIAVAMEHARVQHRPSLESNIADYVVSVLQMTVFHRVTIVEVVKMVLVWSAVGEEYVTVQIDLAAFVVAHSLVITVSRTVH